ncbi:MAG: hypothetical protein KUG77_02130 [Nannocystaceae bacterium]|nr:hypothetical protein [Nannocystaceae bacterium]
MKSKARLRMLACAIALCGCDGDTDPAENGTTGDQMATTDVVATTIPVTSVTDTMTGPTTNGSSSSSDTDMSTGSDTGSTSSGSGTGGSTSTSTGTAESSSSTTDATTGGSSTWTIEWCNLQFPPMIEGDTATTTTAYARVYAEGLTDQTPGNDTDAQLLVEFGYGADGSDPAADDWTWVTGAGNVGWNGTDAGQPDNDEYQGDLQFGASGTYDYAARVSGDGGEAWVYCDLDGLVEGGYSSDQAGNAVIQ